MADFFECEFDVKKMVSVLRKELPDMEWRLGDSEYDGSYVLGRTESGVRIKITEEVDADEAAVLFANRGGPGKYHLGIYFAGSNEAENPPNRAIVTAELRRRIGRALVPERSR